MEEREREKGGREEHHNSPDTQIASIQIEIVTMYGA